MLVFFLFSRDKLLRNLIVRKKAIKSFRLLYIRSFKCLDKLLHVLLDIYLLLNKQWTSHYPAIQLERRWNYSRGWINAPRCQEGHPSPVKPERNSCITLTVSGIFRHKTQKQNLLGKCINLWNIAFSVTQRQIDSVNNICQW